MVSKKKVFLKKCRRCLECYKVRARKSKYCEKCIKLRFWESQKRKNKRDTSIHQLILNLRGEKKKK